MCGGGGGTPQEMPEVTQAQINQAVSLPEGFRAEPVPISQGGGYRIVEPGGDVYQQAATFGELVSGADQLGAIAGSGQALFDPESNQFINRRTGQQVTAETLRNQPALQETGRVGGRTVGVPGADEDVPGITELAYGLMAEGIELPEQQVAQLNADQQRAFQLAREGIGVYKPYLNRAGELTEEGVAALQQSLGATRDLAAQIPGVVDPGRAALERAATRVEGFAGEGASALQRGALGVESSARKGISEADIAAERARASTAEAQRQLQEASQFGLSSAQQGIAGLAPEAAAGYMSQFEDAAVQQALADIARQGELQEQQIGAQAVQSGAFGGSRQAVAEQELARNVLEQQARTAAQMRQAGFDAAASRALQAAQLTGQLGQIGSGAAAGAAEAGGRLGLSAEELAQRSALQGGQLGITGAQTAGQMGAQGAQMQMQGAETAGNLGLQSSNLGLAGIQAGLGAQQQAAGIGQGIAGLGQQTLGLGQAAQQMNLQDVNTMSTIGAQQQRQAQAELDAAYANQYQQAMQPYQQLAFASDIITGAPSGQASTMSQPGPSIGSQLVGLGTAAYGLGQSGLFGGQ